MKQKKITKTISVNTGVFMIVQLKYLPNNCWFNNSINKWLIRALFSVDSEAQKRRMHVETYRFNLYLTILTQIKWNFVLSRTKIASVDIMTKLFRAKC